MTTFRNTGKRYDPEDKENQPCEKATTQAESILAQIQKSHAWRPGYGFMVKHAWNADFQDWRFLWLLRQQKQVDRRMNTHDFLHRNVKEELLKMGFSDAVAGSAAGDALQYYKSTAQFKKGAVHDSLQHGIKRAKALAKIR